MDMFRHVACTR